MLSCDETRASDTPSPPPYPLVPASPLQPSPPDTNMKQILSSGHYYSFDKDNTYEPVMQVST